VNDPDYRFAPGRAVLLRDGSDVTVLATGTTVGRALDAADLLAAEGISARVLNVPSIKPFDEDAVVAAARETGRLVTVEEALTSGGLGGAVAESVVRHHPVPVRFVGVPDRFAPTGSAEWLFDHFGISATGIASTARELVTG
jgi:transketolase